MLFSRLLPDQAECLADLTAEVYQQAGLTGSDIQFTVAGMSGVDFPEEHDRQWEDVAKALSFPREKTALVNDGVVALWGATCRNRAVLLQHGTGMSTFYRNELTQENKKLRKRNDRLHAEVIDIKSRLSAIEAHARSELGLIKPGETFFQIIDK